MEVYVNVDNAPLGGVLGCSFLNDDESHISIIWGKESKIIIGKETHKYETQNELLRILTSSFKNVNVMGETPMDKVIADHWLTICLTMQDDLLVVLNYLEQTLNNLTYLVGNRLTFADLAVFGSLHAFKISSYPKNITRWMKLIAVQPCVVKIMSSLPPEVRFQTSAYAPKKQRSVELRETPENGGRQQEGKFVELPGAEMGKVIVRFPPEASGYLHIGHAKAALLNQYYQQMFKGKLIMRFDDTNPEKENAHFEKVILEDVKMLNIKPDIFSHTSEYFDTMIEMCEKLIKENKAYVDDTPGEQMKSERDQKMESVNRNNSVEKNLEMWNKMKLGTEEGAKCCVRAKIDMQSLNGCMRDPTIYRCKFEEHPRTGFKYKVYPTYDFACPIVDALENVTHVLRTMEYHDRDPQFYWFIDALGLRKPYIWEYSRLNMTNTVLSKRKLTWFVQQGHVDGWDDPRFPTVRGILRRGMTVEGLKQFIIAQGSSRSVVVMEWDKIWAFNKKVIDGIAPRYTALVVDPLPIAVNVKNVSKYSPMTVPCHPKNPDVGNKTVWIGPKVFIDFADAKQLKVGENCTFINWGNLMITKIHKCRNGDIESIDAVTNLENKDFKKTAKLTWLADAPTARFVPTYCVFFDHIISKAILGKDEDFKNYIGHNTRTEILMHGDPSLAELKKGDIIQLQRRGFFKVDIAYAPSNEISGCVQHCVLYHIPDGHTKDSSQPQASKSNAKNPEKKISSRTKEEINKDIVEQGNKIRSLKQQKGDKQVIQAEVVILTALKAEYKDVTNSDWTPEVVAPKQITLTPCKDSDPITVRINYQDEKIKMLKAAKTDMLIVADEIQKLMQLKKEYKDQMGKEWTPDVKPPSTAPVPESVAKTEPSKDELLNKITDQGNTVRELKSNKASKADIDTAVKVLLTLKADYKNLTGSVWTPESGVKQQTTEIKTSVPSTDVNSIIENIAQQGDKIRKLKADKADKKIIEQEVKTLLELKKEYKNQTGSEWTVNVKPSGKAQEESTSSQSVEALPQKAGQAELVNKITDQGNTVRDLKSKKAQKDDIDAAVKVLLSLKAQYKELTGEDFPAPQQPQKKQDKVEKPKQEKVEKPKQEKAEKPRQEPKHKKEEKSASPAPKCEAPAGALKKQTRLGLEAKKESNLPDWYSQVITKGEMIDYYDISGCYILRPWSFSIWDAIRNFLSAEFKKMGVKDCYFPIFVSKAALEREKTHIADFAPEVAWVTKSGESDLAEPIAVRPTSETGMYPAYAKWIQSYRDLPLRLNQWNNVVRWEFQHPQPFLRSREFLWQEGHTAFATKEAAGVEVLEILDLYARVYTDYLAIPVVKGRKTEKEKFAGGDYTTTVEAFVPASGRGIQGATSHHLGQNFAKMFEIIVDDPETQEKRYIYQNSWGITTRTIGVMVMVHGDNQGLVIPPKVAATQVVIVPCGITVSTNDEDRKTLMDNCAQLEKKLADSNIEVYGDYRDNYSPGWKFNHWELKGVPVRIELGPKDLSQGQFVAVRRDTGVKAAIKIADATNAITTLLDTIQRDMLNKATAERDAHLKKVYGWEEFKAALDDKNIILAPYCGEISCEDSIKKDSAKVEVEGEQGDGKAPAMGAKALCIPFDQPKEKLPEKCIYPTCTSKTKYFTLFGRSY